MNAAYTSLMSAVQGYFDTYRALSFAGVSVDFENVQEQKINENSEYRCDYFTSITHFQHFVEIILKDLIKNLNKSKKIEKFSDMIKYLRNCKTEKMEDEFVEEINFWREHRGVLWVLNKLRNFAWHQGVIKKDYCSYDFFVGYKILSLVSNFFEIPKYSCKRLLWSYKKIHAEVDLMKEIYKEFKERGKNADYEKNALLKEMGRAAYQNSLFVNEGVGCNEKNYSLRRRVMQLANRDMMDVCDAKTKILQKVFPYSKIFRCPVCGQKTLVKFIGAGDEDVADENGTVSHEVVETLDKYECQVCSFRINSDIKSLSINSIDGKEVWMWKGMEFFALAE